MKLCKTPKKPTPIDKIRILIPQSLCFFGCLYIIAEPIVKTKPYTMKNKGIMGHEGPRRERNRKKPMKNANIPPINEIQNATIGLGVFSEFIS